MSDSTPSWEIITNENTYSTGYQFTTFGFEWPNFNWSTDAVCPPGQEDEIVHIPPNIFENISYGFEEKYIPPWEIGLKVTFYVIAMFMAAVGNACVLFVIIFNRRMRNRTYFYIGNLALSDMMIGVFNMWIHLGQNITDDWPFSSLLCKLFPFFQVLALTASTGCMAVIAAERFFATVYPMKAKFTRIYKHCIIVTVVWIIAIVVAVPMLLVRRMSLLIWADRDQKWCEEVWPRYIAGVNPNPGSGGFCKFEYPQRRAYYTVQVVVMYFVPVLVAIIAYSVIVYTLWKRRPPGHHTDQILEQQQRTKRKVMRMLIVVFAVFVVCWTPQEVIVLMDANWPEYSNENIPREFRYVAIFIAYFNSSLNPILYGGLNEKFRKGFRELFKCHLCRFRKVAAATTESNRGTHPHPTAENQNLGVQGQVRRKSLTLLRQGQPRLPPISEDQFEACHNGVNKVVPAIDCDKSTCTDNEDTSADNVDNRADNVDNRADNVDNGTDNYEKPCEPCDEFDMVACMVLTKPELFRQTSADSNLNQEGT